jgi:hypothetical protein
MILFLVSCLNDEMGRDGLSPPRKYALLGAPLKVRGHGSIIKTKIPKRSISKSLF